MGSSQGPHTTTSAWRRFLASNGEREIEWDFHRGRKQTHNIQSKELETKDTPRSPDSMRDEDKRAGRGGVDYRFYRWIRPEWRGSRRILEQARQRQTTRPVGGQLPGIKATHYDGEFEGIALALERHTDVDTNMVALLSDCKPAIWVVEKLDSGAEAPRSSIEARIQHALETRENKYQYGQK